MMYYQAQLNGTATSPLVWNLNLMQTSKNKSSTTTSPYEVVQSWRVSRSCDVLIGSGYADLDTTLVGSVDVPWIEPVVSLPPLTDRSEFPNILNGVSTLNETAWFFAEAFHHVKEWSVLNDESTTSRAWRAAIEAHLHNDHHSIGVQREILLSNDAEAIANAISDIKAARSRYVFVLPSIYTEKFESILIALLHSGLHKTKVIMFIDEACAFGPVELFPGSFCVKVQQRVAKPSELTITTSHEYPGYLAFARANVANIGVAHSAQGFSVNASLVDRDTYFANLVHDSVLHYMLVANKDLSRAPTREDLRTNATSGVTGAMSFDANGVRTRMAPELINVAANGSKMVVGTLESGNGRDWTPTPTNAYVLGSEYSIKALPDTYPPVSESPASKTTLIIGLAAGGVALLILALAAAYVLKTLLRPDGRNNSAAPKDESKPFTVIFTDIQASTALWAAAPQAMSGAVEQHHALIRQLIAEFKGYEVKTIGDSFMVAFVSPADAARFGVAVQRRFFHANWPYVIERAYMGQAADLRLGDGATDPELWNGLRVRVGIHYDTGRITLDPVTKGYDYYGTVTNTAARVETIGNGGQVLLTAAALEAAEKESPGVTNQCVVTDLGEENLRGLNEATRLYQVVPKEFELREFPPLRVDRLENEEFEDLEQEGHSGDLQMDSDATPHGSPRKSVLSDHKTKASSVSSHPEGTEGAYVAFLEVLLSPLPDNERGTVLAFFVQRWRVAASTKSSALGSNKKVAKKAIEGVAKRAGAAHQCLLQGNEADMGESSSVPPRTGGRRSTGQRKSSTQQTHQQPLPNPFAGRKSGAGAMYRTHSGHLEPHGSGYLPQHPKGSIGSDRMSVQSTSP